MLLDKLLMQHDRERQIADAELAHEVHLAHFRARWRAPRCQAYRKSYRYQRSAINHLRRPPSLVCFPPGRARLLTNPALTGSPTFTITIGIVSVTFFTAKASPVARTTMTSTLRRTSSSTSAGYSSCFPSAKRRSTIILWPSIYPSSCRPC